MQAPSARKVLNVGGNSKDISLPAQYDGWEHVLLDVDPACKPDIVCDARNMRSLDAREFDAVYCAHNLEHYYRHEVPRVLEGFVHVLKTGGFVDIRVPDIGRLIRMVAENDMDIDDTLYQSAAGPITVRDVLYGYDAEIERSGNSFFAHKTGFTRKSLENVLTQCGFSQVYLDQGKLEIRAVAFPQEPADYARDVLAGIGTDEDARQTASDGNNNQHVEDTVREAMQAGLLAFNEGDLQQATLLCQEILRIRPNHAEALNLLGLIAHYCGQSQRAIQFFKAAIQARPSEPGCWVNLGLVHKAAGDPEQAIACYKRAIDLDSKQLEAYNNLGTCHLERNDLAEASMALSTLLALAPAHTEGNFNLGNVLAAQGMFNRAARAYRVALDQRPDHQGAWQNLGNALKNLGRVGEALASYEEAMGLAPDNAAIFSNYLLALEYSPTVDADTRRRAHKRFEQRFSVQELERPRWRRSRKPLRIGYLSPDFRTHPIAFFATSILENHNRNSYEVVCYSDVASPDGDTERARKAADVWRNIYGVGNDSVVDLIVSDEIDILVDLAGHTGANRLPLLARRPSPLQVTYLGYPGTTGMSCIDFCITDAIVTPLCDDDDYAEALFRLPGPFFCYSPPTIAPAITSLPCKKNGFVTFGVFHSLAKVSGQVLGLWARMLRGIPGSRLLWQNRAFAESDTQQNILEAFAKHGVEHDRITLKEQTDLYQHLALHGSIDICLDTFPWSGHTTTCHALWMGVPVLGITGKRHAARLSESTLVHGDLSELVFHDPEEWVRGGISLARKVDRLETYRRSLRSKLRTSPLMDTTKFTRTLETAYTEMLARTRQETRTPRSTPLRLDIAPSSAQI